MRMQSEAGVKFSDWVEQVVEWAPDDAELPGGLDSINLILNRKRLAEFLQRFQSDSDVQDFLLLDLLGVEIGTEISSTGEVEEVADLALRPFRLWEYIWLYKILGLAEGGKSVLDLGGPASHVILAAALAGSQVHSVDLNPRIVAAGQHCAQALGLTNYRAEVGDMRDLSSIATSSMDRIVCCSVLEHLAARDQEKALSEMARVLAPGGVIGLTFDYGVGAPGTSIYLPPPHEPPGSAGEVRSRYVHSGLEVLGGGRLEDPVPGSLFPILYRLLYNGRAILRKNAIRRTGTAHSDASRALDHFSPSNSRFRNSVARKGASRHNSRRGVESVPASR